MFYKKINIFKCELVVYRLFKFISPNPDPYAYATVGK